MAPLCLIAFVSLVFGGAIAQTDSNSNRLQRVWASVVFINHGETTPQFGPLQTILTPEGAQQMFRQGTAFRNRYLSVNNKEPGPDAAPIRNISQGAINNAQIAAMSQSDEYVVAGATAFFQGMYPGNEASYNNNAGGMDLARNLPSGQNLTNYPLGGYQYPQVQTYSRLDVQYPTLQGTADCQTWRAETAKLTGSEELQQSYRGSQQFYQDLFGSGPLQGLLDPAQADYWKAYEIHELVRYMYTHNSTVFNQLENANDTLALLEANALELETALTSPRPNNKDEESDKVFTIGGRTLADRVEYQLMANAESNGEYNKLTIMFGTHMPMMSFFHIADLKPEDGASSEPFARLPSPGSAMAFELIGTNEDEMTAMPPLKDLRVRFMYRDSADEAAEFKAAALFGSSAAEQGLPWTDFSRLMRNVGVDPFSWCDVCQPTDASWCKAAGVDRNRSGNGGGSGNDSMSPVVAGAIGALVTLAVTAILGLALFLICGFRLRRAEKPSGDAVVGGFKGTERMPDDKDVAVTKGGTQRERVGSWELRGEPGTPPAFNGAGIVTSDFRRREESMKVDDDGISVTGARVVNTRESV